MGKRKCLEKKINDAVYKRAIGYEANEIVEEYSFDESGDCILNKRKVTKKHISPDLSAAKLFLEKLSEVNNSELKELTEEELNKEKLKLIKLLEKNK